MPDWTQYVRPRLSGLRLSPTREAEIVEELSQHLDDRWRELIASGASPDEAERLALADFRDGNVLAERIAPLRQAHPPLAITPGARGGKLLSDFWQDLRYGARMLVKNPGFTVAAVMTLALGIGANTALFSVVDAMLLKKLPVKEPQRLALFQNYHTPGKFDPGSYYGLDSVDPVTGQTRMTSFPLVSYQRMREQQGALSHLFAFSDLGLNVLAGGQADVANGQVASGNYYAGLGVRPLLGRVLTDEDDKPNAAPVAVLSYRYWQKRFGADAGIVGKQINLNNVAFTVIGVTSQGFDGAGQVGETRDITIPLALEPLLNADPKRSILYDAR